MLRQAIALLVLTFAACPLFPVEAPADFPKFSFAGHEAEARLLSRYLWYHFGNRPGHYHVPFNMEYLTTSDLWMGGALHPGWPQPIQEIHRQDLLEIRMNPDGYVWTHQHFSHAHEQGWPFPIWTQARAGSDGLAAGWHFQDDGPGWVWELFLRRHPDSPFGRAKAMEGWELENVRSLGISDRKWQLEATGPSPRITTPAGVSIDSFNAPFLQLRWQRHPAAPPNVRPYIEWMREPDREFSAERRVYLAGDTGNPDYEAVSGAVHSQAGMYRHPLWNGRIKRLRIALAPGESRARFAIDSFFTAYDTRHSINNPIYILACWDFFRWTGDTAFLRTVINRMRLALRFQQTEMGGLRSNHIRNAWPGHDGIPGFIVHADGTKTVQYGHGIGSNYWDLLPFGWDDMYATSQYYASLVAMAEAEDAVRANPGWDVPGGAPALDPAALRAHAAEVKRAANRKFWSQAMGRFVACVDKNGAAHDYGFTFLNLDAIWYGIATDAHARSILEWLAGRRLVRGDTSTGADIYRWRFGPRATTRRNIDWYGFFWTRPEKIPWGGQVQDGGAVLGFSFYDLWARLRVLGPDNAWERLREMLRWEEEAWSAGGYRKYYEGGKRGTSLQGGGTAGGIGIDNEFYESSLIPSIVIRGFLGLDPRASELRVNPRLPSACPSMGVTNLLYRGARLDLSATRDAVEVRLKEAPREPIRIALDGAREAVRLTGAGVYRLAREVR